ncbi:MAG: hypothetical protein GX379_02950 [Clostridiales bacterium]|jgi:hypothetical protein|nr:hypothetical protein [Clostridiales bacterium]
MSLGIFFFGLGVGVGALVGAGVGLGVGNGVGAVVGKGVGKGVGEGVGEGVGALVGAVVGIGVTVGLLVGSGSITVSSILRVEDMAASADELFLFPIIIIRTVLPKIIVHSKRAIVKENNTMLFLLLPNTI